MSNQYFYYNHMFHKMLDIAHTQLSLLKYNDYRKYIFVC